jgi:hypothetical protein
MYSGSQNSTPELFGRSQSKTTVTWIPNGRPGTVATLAAMKALALRNSRTLGIQALAQTAVGYRAPELIPFAVDTFVRERWRTLPDPLDTELVRAPVNQLRAIEAGRPFSGDCDDAATLICSMLAAVEYPCWFSAIRLPGAVDFSHVFAQAPAGGAVLDLDPTVDPSDLPIEGYEERLIVSVYE